MSPQRGGMPLVEVVRFVIGILIAWAQQKAWGEIRITVQAGQVEFVHESRSHRDRLPQAGTDGEQVRQVLAAAS